LKSGYTEDLEGRVRGEGLRVALVAARFNAHITERLLERGRACLLEHGVDEAAAEVFRVPGAWELPQAVGALARTGRFDAVIAYGCVIRGDTPHFEFIAGEAARGLAEAARDTGVPVIFGVLTTENEAQAAERADPDGQDKGREAALSALAMARLIRGIRGAEASS
jgi:6,7-dimethyl-8-ribityllumazine synthase